MGRVEGCGWVVGAGGAGVHSRSIMPSLEERASKSENLDEFELGGPNTVEALWGGTTVFLEAVVISSLWLRSLTPDFLSFLSLSTVVNTNRPFFPPPPLGFLSVALSPNSRAPRRLSLEELSDLPRRNDFLPETGSVEKRLENGEDSLPEDESRVTVRELGTAEEMVMLLSSDISIPISLD